MAVPYIVYFCRRWQRAAGPAEVGRWPTTTAARPRHPTDAQQHPAAEKKAAHAGRRLAPSWRCPAAPAAPENPAAAARRPAASDDASQRPAASAAALQRPGAGHRPPRCPAELAGRVGARRRLAAALAAPAELTARAVSWRRPAAA